MANVVKQDTASIQRELDETLTLLARDLQLKRLPLAQIKKEMHAAVDRVNADGWRRVPNFVLPTKRLTSSPIGSNWVTRLFRKDAYNL